MRLEKVVDQCEQAIDQARNQVDGVKAEVDLAFKPWNGIIGPVELLDKVQRLKQKTQTLSNELEQLTEKQELVSAQLQNQILSAASVVENLKRKAGVTN